MERYFSKSRYTTERSALQAANKYFKGERKPPKRYIKKDAEGKFFWCTAEDRHLFYLQGSKTVRVIQ